MWRIRSVSNRGPYVGRVVPPGSPNTVSTSRFARLRTIAWAPVRTSGPAARRILDGVAVTGAAAGAFPVAFAVEGLAAIDSYPSWWSFSSSHEKRPSDFGRGARNVSSRQATDDPRAG